MYGLQIRDKGPSSRVPHVHFLTGFLTHVTEPLPLVRKQERLEPSSRRGQALSSANSGIQNRGWPRGISTSGDGNGPRGQPASQPTEQASTRSPGHWGTGERPWLGRVHAHCHTPVLGTEPILSPQREDDGSIRLPSGRYPRCLLPWPVSILNRDCNRSNES